MDSAYKRTVVGRFFERVGHSILGGKLTRDSDGDVFLPRIKTSVEIKSSMLQSSYGFRLHVDQIEEYDDLSLFYGRRVWYMFFSYHNPLVTNRMGGRSNALAKYDVKNSICRYVAENALWCSVVDFSIVEAWRRTRTYSTKSVMGHPGARTVNISCHEVHALSNGGYAEGMRSLGFDPSGFSVSQGLAKAAVRTSRSRELTLQFPLTLILPPKDLSVAKRLLRRRGVLLSRVRK